MARTNSSESDGQLSLFSLQPAEQSVAVDLTADLLLDLDAFVRSVAINRGLSHAFLLGAGASITSGVQSAAQCIWEWKRQIFLTNNYGLEDQFSDASLPSVRQRIQRWLDAEGCFPAENASEEYGFYVEACYPISADRRRYFESLVQGKTPHVGYQLLASLAAAEIVKAIWTTNFDGFAAKTIVATGVAATPIEVGLDTSQRVGRPVGRGEVLCVALHGDYRYDELKNTPQEVQRQDKTLRRALVRQVQESTLVVVGYSGRDQSVVAALEEGYSQPGPGRLYWCGFEQEPSDSVRRFLVAARQHGHQAYYVPTHGFDDLMLRLALQCLDGEPRRQAQELYTQAAAQADSQPAPFTVESTSVNGLIKSNAFAVECPSEVLQFDADLGAGPGVWARVRGWTNGHNVVAVPFRGKVLALGTVDDVKEAFRGRLRGEIERSPIQPSELAHQDGAVVSLLCEALVRAAAEVRGLQTDGHKLVWVAQAQSNHEVSGIRYQVYDAALLCLRRYGGKQYLVVKPTLKAKTRDGADAPPEVEQELKRRLLSRQWNRQFSQAVQEWRRRLCPDEIARFEFPPNSGSTFRFNVALQTTYTKLAIPRARWSIKIPAMIAKHTQYHGIQHDEPPLLFSNRSGDGFVKDPHPVRGIVRNRPYDFALTERGLLGEVSLGIICPKPDMDGLATYLSQLHQQVRPETKQEYLLPFPGFAQAFCVPLQVPGLESSLWMPLSEPASDLGVREGAAQLRRELMHCIDILEAGHRPSLVLIYVPTRWANWEAHAVAGERRFDLHDFVKAYCVQKGLATQFLREATLSKSQQGEVLWWLALSFYAKAMRTPWVLDALGPDVAFMGLGFSVERSQPRGQHVIVGCSHIYSADGRGLRYRLSKLDNFVIRRGNPFMSKDDARRMAEYARQLFFESLHQLPRRVVIHKRTPYSREELQGLREGLAGVDAIDMLEVTEDPVLRYTATRVFQGQVQDDPFPVARGTAVALNGRQALLWVHGSADALQPGKHYYLGKNRIPAPLLITRHAGTSPLSTVAQEILGLSKMNWNTFDLYSKFPATIDSSNTIARIGSLLERFGPVSYDYRLFI